MFAIVESGGKQYRVSVDDVINVDRLDCEPGSSITLKVLAFSSADGAIDFNSKCTVTANAVEHFKDEKVIAFKRRRRHTYKRKKGFRASLTTLKIVSIS